jgi:hypothetical protein
VRIVRSFVKIFNKINLQAEQYYCYLFVVGHPVCLHPAGTGTRTCKDFSYLLLVLGDQPILVCIRAKPFRFRICTRLWDQGVDEKEVGGRTERGWRDGVGRGRAVETKNKEIFQKTGNRNGLERRKNRKRILKIGKRK